jgi:hypothetical protein
LLRIYFTTMLYFKYIMTLMYYVFAEKC